MHNRPVYIQFVREKNVNKRKDNCIWWHLESRRWQIGSCHDIGSKSKNYGAYFDEDLKCLPGAQTKDRWKQTSSNSYLSGRTEGKLIQNYYEIIVMNYYTNSFCKSHSKF